MRNHKISALVALSVMFCCVHLLAGSQTDAADTKTWKIVVENRGGVVPKPVSKTTTIDSDGKITLNRSDQAEASTKDIDPAELGELKTAIDRAKLMKQGDVDNTSKPCVGSRGASVKYTSGDKTNEFEIRGSAMCNIKPDKLRDLMKEVQQLQSKYF